MNGRRSRVWSYFVGATELEKGKLYNLLMGTARIVIRYAVYYRCATDLNVKCNLY